MKFNKKGGLSFLEVGFSIFSLFFIIASALTGMILIYEAIGEYGIDTTVAIGTNISNSLGANNQTVVNMEKLQTEYNDFSFPYDLYILALFIIGVSVIFEAASQSSKMGIFSFFGMLFFGAQVFLLGVLFVEQALDWYIGEFFATLFSNVALDIPISIWLFDNLSVICALIFFVATLINQLDLKMEFGRRGRAEK